MNQFSNRRKREENLSQSISRSKRGNPYPFPIHSTETQLYIHSPAGNFILTGNAVADAGKIDLQKDTNTWDKRGVKRA